jgi:ribonuclease P protein component
MLRARERLSRTALDECMRKGRRFSGALFDIRYRKTTGFRAAVVISKKVSPTSVGRHARKRKVVAAIKSRYEALSGIEMVIILKKVPDAPTIVGYTEALDTFLATK